MFWFFSNKKRVDEIKEDTKKSFDSVKRDIGAVGGWIKHLNSERELQKKEIDEIKQDLSSIKEEIDGIKNVLSIINQIKPNNQLKINKQMFNKQSSVFAVQTGVQTGVQTPKLDSFSVTERAILWILLNTDMKLSYDDLASMLGKERSTIRGQLNRIKQKNEDMLEEVIEQNGKKRVFIPENIKEILLKKTKVRVRKDTEKQEK
jgi:hypothetical protein